MQSGNDVSNWLKLVLLTPVFILLAHYLAFFPHEYAHSFTAWFLGDKTNPFALNYGTPTVLNILIGSGMDENVDYATIFAAGHPLHASLIAFAGSGIANSLLFILSYFLLKNKTVQMRPYLFYFIFLFNLMNLGNFYDYVPIRTFADYGDVNNDVSNLITGLNISPWGVFITFGYIVAFLIWQFFAKTMISAYKYMRITSNVGRAALMIICVFILFGYFGGFTHIYFIGQQAVGDIIYFLSATSFIAMPGIIIALWPTRLWVKQRVQVSK